MLRWEEPVSPEAYGKPLSGYHTGPRGSLVILEQMGADTWCWRQDALRLVPLSVWPFWWAFTRLRCQYAGVVTAEIVGA